MSEEDNDGKAVGSSPLLCRETVLEFNGQLENMAFTKMGSRFLQTLLLAEASTAGDSEGQKDRPRGCLEPTFEELLPLLPSLATNKFGNYLVQVLFQVAHAQQRAAILGALAHDVGTTACEGVGSYTIQNILKMLAKALEEAKAGKKAGSDGEGDGGHHDQDEHDAELVEQGTRVLLVEMAKGKLH